MWEELSKRFSVRLLTLEDKQIILDLYQTNPSYFRYCPPKPSLESIEQDLLSFPPLKTEKDKKFLGFFEGDRLVATLDMISHYPKPRTVFIGLFMLDADYQGKGVASQLMSEILENMSNAFDKVRLGVVSSNLKARAFWQKQGFVLTGERKETETYEILLAEKTLRNEYRSHHDERNH